MAHRAAATARRTERFTPEGSMPIDRREWLTRTTQLLAAGAMSPRLLDLPVVTEPKSIKEQFPAAMNQAYLNNAGIHPMNISTMRAVEEFLHSRTYGEGPRHDPDPTVPKDNAKARFASLINAKPSEISLVPSTTVGENLVVSGLDIPKGNGNVVTDALHFDGSLYMYESLKARGLDVRIAMPRNWRIELPDLDRLIDRNTKLVALSAVSFVNGFQHDLKAVCDLAHSRGALVYADIVQAAGAVPIDVRASGVDFCASSSFKWLMADLGVGFMYVREELLDRVLKRTQYGFRQVKDFHYHFLPLDMPNDAPVTWDLDSGAGARFEVGTWSSSTLVAVNDSLGFIQRVGVERIQAHNRALAQRLQKELPRLGFEALTPPDTASAIVAFVAKAPETTAAKLTAARVVAKITGHVLRASPSIYNDDSDIDRMLTALT
jgi:selenocysteine lyase/cysteine desulfurase